ncbi:MAG TPA: cyclase family protein [Ktedonobacteraceae bacterium]
MASVQELADLFNTMEVVDLSPLFYTNMPLWHSHPDVAIIDDARTIERNGYFLQTLILPEHSGSHVDAPPHNHPHLIDETIENIPLTTLMGVAKKIDLSQENYAPGELVPFSKIQQKMKESNITVQKGDIVFFEFGWDKYLIDIDSKGPNERNWWGRNEPGLDEETCRFFSEAGVKAVGSDTSACDIALVDGVTKHQFGHAVYFLPKSILIVEGLFNLAKLPTTFYFIALPLKIKGGSGSPLRPIGIFPRA